MGWACLKKRTEKSFKANRRGEARRETAQKNMVEQKSWRILTTWERQQKGQRPREMKGNYYRLAIITIMVIRVNIAI